MSAMFPKNIRFGREVCGDLAQAERREWWLANGLGGYAAGNIAGTLTRRYHGLLIAPVTPPLNRHLVVSKADAVLIDGERRIPLFSNRWRDDVIEPEGYAHIESFSLEGRTPVWRFAIGNIVIEQRIWMEQGANATYVAYRLAPDCIKPDRPLKLAVKILINARNHHDSGRPWNFNPFIENSHGEIKVLHPQWFELNIKACGGYISSDHSWYENFQLSIEKERGLPDLDSHLCVGEAILDLADNDWVGVVASIGVEPSKYLTEAVRRNIAHEEGLLKLTQIVEPAFIGAPDWVKQLVLTSANFIFSRPLAHQPDGESVIAGYPWFGDWGRDTMIALPGLTLVTGRYDTARKILLTFAHYVDQGMLPNYFPGAGETPEYNTADAALWYIEAWRAFIASCKDLESLRFIYPVLVDIVDWHIKGTRYGIQLDDTDGLLRAGEPGFQVTWMDAKVGDSVFTPRIGKPVEINALWYNALIILADFAQMLNQPNKKYLDLAKKARKGFVRYVRDDGLGLIDVLDGPNGDDFSIRPNQIFAVSLANSPLEKNSMKQVVDICGKELLTSYGLRSLHQADANFRPRYQGGVWERDSSYHQGPVWAFLLGHYALAEYRVTQDAVVAQAKLEPIRDHLCDAALGNVSEIFDGAAPHIPRGAPAQAWSVACTLDAWVTLEKAKRFQQTLPESKNKTVEKKKDIA